MERLILRLVEKRVRRDGDDVFKIHFIDGVQEVVVERYLVEYRGLILQKPHTPDAMRYRGPLAIAPQPWKEYCRWHSGPIDARDDPATRIYCTMTAEGYCREHKRSLRAIYEYCMSLRGDRAIGACRMLDKEVSLEYVVYMTDGGSSKPKVGVTRRFRLYDRVAEQNHNVATVIAILDSALEARRLEMRISRAGLATESQARRSSTNLQSGIRMLIAAAEKASRIAGKEWDGRLFRVVPRNLVALRRLKETSPESLEGQLLEVVDYWAGLLLAKTSDGRPVVLRVRKMVHRDSVMASL